MKVKTVHDVRPIVAKEEWKDAGAIFRLYKWSLYVLRNDSYAGYTDCSPDDVELFLEHTTLDCFAVMYMEGVYQLPIISKKSMKKVCDDPKAVYDRLKPYIEAVINERVEFGSNTRLGLYFR